MLDQQQVISGLAILLSFFVGYKYALKVSVTAEKDDSGKAGASGGTTEERVSYNDQKVTLPCIVKLNYE
jgi:hypothetical protein